MTRKVRIRLTGGDAELGRIAASDVAELLLGFERAMARASGHVVGKALKKKGRWARAVEDAVKLRLVNIESGSVVAVLEVPDAALPEGSLNLQASSLGELALDRTLAVAAGKKRDSDVAAALVAWGESVGIGSRHTAIEVAEGRRKTPRVTIDDARMARLQRIVDATPRKRADRISGVLVEADFESHKAHVRTPTSRVVVDFDETLAADVKDALRERADLVGEVEFDPKTNAATSVRVKKIERGHQIPIGLEPGDFYLVETIEELGAHLGIGPVQDLETLRDKGATREEIDAMFDALAD